MQSVFSCPSSLVCSESLFQAGWLCLAPVCSRRSLGLSFPQASGSSALAPGHGSSGPAAAAERCCHVCWLPRSPGGGEGPCEGRLGGTATPSAARVVLVAVMSYPVPSSNPREQGHPSKALRRDSCPIVSFIFSAISKVGWEALVPS